MIRSTLIAVAAILSVGPALAASHGQGTGHGRYTSFALKVPYEFDLPREITTAYVSCQVRTVGNGSRFYPQLIIDLTESTSGLAVIGFGDFDTSGADVVAVFESDEEESLRAMMAGDRFELAVSCGINTLIGMDGRQHSIMEDKDGRFGIFLGSGIENSPMAWMTDDFVHLVTRTFNEAENEAFGAFDGGPLTDAVTNQSTATVPTQGSGGGLSTLEGILTRP